jgi:hypothetical protein
MKKNGFLAILCLVLLAGPSFQARAETENEVTVSGMVEKIAWDDSTIQVDGQVILVSNEILEESMIEVGDRLQVRGIRKDGGIRLIDFRFLADENEMSPYQGSEDEEEYPEEYPGDENEEDGSWDWGEDDSSL